MYSGNRICAIRASVWSTRTICRPMRFHVWPGRAIASWQPPLLAHEDQRTAAGQPAPKNLFPCHALLSAGVKIAFGTDSSPWISGVIAPLQALEMALERTAPDGTRITLDEALRAFTSDAAYAEFAEKEKGSLVAGKLADFVLFDRDFSRGPAHGMSAAKVRLTVIGGRVATKSEATRRRELCRQSRRPERVVLEGKYVKIVPLDAGAHAAALYAGSRDVALAVPVQRALYQRDGVS